jgi:hypothetical protein
LIGLAYLQVNIPINYLETPNNKGKRIELCSLLFIIFHILVLDKIKNKFKDKFILQTKSSSSSFCLFLYVVFVSGEANAGNARDYSCRTRRVPLVEQKLLNLPEHSVLVGFVVLDL